MNQWNELVPAFHHPGGIDKITAGSADNILIGWPPTLDLIRRTFPAPHGFAALDIGCGGGQFCWKLHQLGFQVTGLDPSEDMIEAARQSLPSDIALIHGQVQSVPLSTSYDLITALMVFQFIEDIQGACRHISDLVQAKGLLGCAVFNPPFVARLLKAGIIFKDFDAPAQPRRGIMELKPGNPIPVFIRSAQDYQDLLNPLGFEMIFEARPPFTPEFLKAYPMDIPTQDPEFLILGFRKQL